MDAGPVLDGLVLGATQSPLGAVAFGPMANALVALVLFATMLLVLRRRRGRAASERTPAPAPAPDKHAGKA